ncbi:cyclic pyranopterin monophosphate synthase MoaC [Comamonas sp.]
MAQHCKTGVGMDAVNAVQIILLTIYDLCKGEGSGHIKWLEQRGTKK